MKKLWIISVVIIFLCINYIYRHPNTHVPLVVFLLSIVVVFIGVMVYSFAYFRGQRFTSIKNSIANYVSECNDLNSHIEDLRNTYTTIRKTDYGSAEFQNISKHKYKKNKLSKAQYSSFIYDCSKTVCDNARKQPFKYICKYFNIKSDEETLTQFEDVLNNYLAAEDGKVLSQKKHQEILNSISKDIPFIVRMLFKEKLNKELGFEKFIFDEVYFPTYSFRYVSAGGNSGSQYDVLMDIDMLERFINFLSESVKFQKSVAGQRRLMTAKLRQFIIDRDKHTCQNCHNSTQNEPNLLLEVDHIIPVSKGGITAEDNLQTLCWKCNRSKGNKIMA